MFKKIAEFFTGKKPEAAPEAPYKVDVVPAGTEASIIASPPTAPAVEAVVVVPEAVVPEAVVEQVLTKTKAPAIKKPRAPKAK
jgi:hypothetical protein